MSATRFAVDLSITGCCTADSAGIACSGGKISGQCTPFGSAPNHYGSPGGPSATIDSELRQARKGATVIIDSCAGVWLFGLPPFLFVTLLLPVFALLIFVGEGVWCILGDRFQ